MLEAKCDGINTAAKIIYQIELRIKLPGENINEKKKVIEICINSALLEAKCDEMNTNANTKSITSTDFLIEERDYTSVLANPVSR